MATGGHALEKDVVISLQTLPVEEEEKDSGDGQEEEDWEKALSVERFGDIISESASTNGEKPGRSYSETDFEYHRHTFHHIHHPLSSHLPPPVRFRKRALSSDRRRKKKRKKRRTSIPPSEFTPTIHEVDEEEAESDGEGQGEAVTPTQLEDEGLKSSLRDDEDLVLPLAFASFHMENECLPSSDAARNTNAGLEQNGQRRDKEAGSRFLDILEPSGETTPTWFHKKPMCRQMGPQRATYDLRERVCIGSMTSTETAVYQKVPTDEAEAQMLATMDLDDMKSKGHHGLLHRNQAILTGHRFEDNPGVRRHLVKRSSRNQVTRCSISSPPRSGVRKKKKSDRKTHDVFVELNELIVDKNEDMHWKERARWIKFEEDVEEETDRWGKPHVASLTFRSLLDLRRTITHGTVLLDLEQTTLPGIAHQIVETMIISDHIKPEDRANVLRALLLKHSHPNDEKEGFFPHNSLVHGMGSSHHNHNHAPEPLLPPVAEYQTEHQESKPQEPDKEVFVSLFKAVHPIAAEGHPAARSMKLLTKIPKDAEATVVLVGCVDFLEQPAMAFVRLNEAVLLESVLEVPIPVRFLFLLLGPSYFNMDYHETGRSISTLMSDKTFHEVAYFADDRQDLLNGINEFLDCSIVIPPSDVEGKDLLKSVSSFQKEMLRKRKERGKKGMNATAGSEFETKEVLLEEQEEEEVLEVDPLKRSGIPFGGLIHDIRRRYPHYVSDIQDAMDTQCVAAIIFIYFAALSPTITFGGLLGEKTDGMMGVSELIVSTATLGVLFSLLAGQPLLIIGFSGPLLVFEEAFYNFCQAHGFEYLTARVWIGFWLIFIVLVIVAAEGSFLVRYITPFTQEIFAFLISLIFIYETFSRLIQVFQEHPLLKSYPAVTPHPAVNLVEHHEEDHHGHMLMQPNTALLSLVLMLGTFFVAFFLRKFRNSRFLGGKARRIIGDFGIPISILCSVIVDCAIPDTYTQKINVPSGFSVTSPDKRGWFISPFGDRHPFPIWMMGASAVPALLVFILIFMETQITSLILSKKERRLVKGSGFHLDLLLIVLLGAVCPLFGLPWLTATTVRSVTHVNALTVMSKATAPGEQPMIQEVKDQRITGMMVSLLIGMSIVMKNVLRHIPLAVLFGIFLYMGITSLTGIQLYERIMLMVTPAKHHPDHIYVTKVKTWRMNMFTVIQLMCIALLWVVKSTVASLAFPFVLIMTVPLRRLILTRVFEERELKALDSEDGIPNFDENGKDEYNELHMNV
ncbi:anion exchange protein 3-like isoform X3 [Brienomyrus brachyistius]|uniref:anion exchange protein 3-like isoform X3 n=1 Tax=Brienomyrus brachyistius TaxID=42636 RepID=UPI0020B216DF|nr:anion exchange protein 3-like isoform X3 [Brienomyrus brachyistius]